MPDHLLFNAFTMSTVSHLLHGLWTHPDSRHRDYADLGAWLELAALLDDADFDALFLADVAGVHETYGGSPAQAVLEGVQVPANDPSMLLSALAASTRRLGLVFTQSILQEPPFNFARRVSTLDHLSRGRVGWNIVTSHLSNAARNLGLDDLPDHDERYARAEEYTEVVYRLWEESWADDAVLADPSTGRYADPAKVRKINHAGTYYRVEGPHLCEPSPQRSPVLFQAGSSKAGREFAARHAEGVFIDAVTPLGAHEQIADIRARAGRHGRNPDDLLFFAGLSFVVGGTEAEAAGKDAEIRAHLSETAFAAQFSSAVGSDVTELGLDTPIRLIRTNTQQGWLTSLRESAPDQEWTLGTALTARMGRRVVGTPERIADQLAEWRAAGVDGVNVIAATTPGTYRDFIDGVLPELRRRGLARTEPTEEGLTLRERLFPGRPARLTANHPAGRRRLYPHRNHEEKAVS
ncbi:LLM class flavin-dependent oxidoreductase [Nonomuraea jabiensis]|uniref:FMN-dependent oxidoreductase (Nitrilotriacetate monooxygenase family) n=1 Tax=Nonomuraea jabiensis TaxID=882448 RepID=A0A7W9GG69_9ACTN|nr:LLM class flavin-dependent oxidoreductase [Nonomuraea jabiensis]MBB5783242.1 FMN-dependent oxidoreductase (nitrilotriacetate monooxygenase family) [Nonomuraea jabiensis]